MQHIAPQAGALAKELSDKLWAEVDKNNLALLQYFIHASDAPLSAILTDAESLRREFDAVSAFNGSLNEKLIPLATLTWKTAELQHLRAEQRLMTLMAVFIEAETSIELAPILAFEGISTTVKLSGGLSGQCLARASELNQISCSCTFHT